MTTIPHPPTSGALMTASAAARHLGIHPSTVARWCSRHLVNAGKFPGQRGRWRIPSAELARLRLAVSA